MRLKTVVLLAIILLIGFFAVEKLRLGRVDKRLQGQSATQQVFAEVPQQTSTSAAPFALKEYQVKPLAQFAIRARVLGREEYSFGREADLSPVDLALGWRRMAEPAVYEPLNITQGGRWYRYSWSSQPPIPLQEIIESSANMHMIPANAAVERVLKKARTGQFIRITGQLVEVTHPGGWRWTSSLTRSDSGANSCELIFVETAQVE
ncbi:MULTISPECIES: hypothetical protein [unclassified Acidovorax]|uniref:hypothetical protein n=1 Tax=unclassified Acidovorax TaxID=2684926 RepID=UPI00070DC0AC|nr:MULTISPECIES: hypothetical protein [unclassified Acidovorax]KRC20861.1 hypothetical protein ASE31_24610 [Acidovorax sp. Root217]KRC26533.1 hypothetical protein ASE28_22995 [Acidovorax sp. Root219]